MVAKGGFEALDGLSDEAKRYIAPLPLNYVPNKSVDEYFGAMKMPGMKQSAAENLSKAQAVKDATMAWSIAERMQSKLVHMNGNFHSTDHCGIITYLNQYRPGLKIGTVEVIRQENTDKLDPEALGKADFLHLRTQRHDLDVLIADKRKKRGRFSVSSPLFSSRRPFRIVRTLFYANRASVLAITSSGSGSIGKT